MAWSDRPPSGARSVDFIFSDDEQTPEPLHPDALLADRLQRSKAAADDHLRQLSAM